MRKLEWGLFSLAAVGVLAAIAITTHLYLQQQERNRLLALGLHNAAVFEPDSIPAILDLGVDVNELNSDDVTALHLATTYKKVQSVEQLLKLGADPNLVSPGDKINPTPLQQATFILNSADELTITQLLLESGADPNAVTPDNETALLRLTRAGGPPAAFAIEWLIDAGADVKMADARGMTPLQYAVLCGNPRVVDMLLTAGADPEQRNQAGFRAIDQINAIPYPEKMQRVFEKHGADSVRRPELFAKHRNKE